MWGSWSWNFYQVVQRERLQFEAPVDCETYQLLKKWDSKCEILGFNIENELRNLHSACMESCARESEWDYSEACIFVDCNEEDSKISSMNN